MCNTEYLERTRKAVRAAALAAAQAVGGQGEDQAHRPSLSSSAGNQVCTIERVIFR